MSHKKEIERRKQSRREADNHPDELYQTFSTVHCRHCLENWDDNVILLDKDKKLVFVTPQAQEIIQKHPEFFTINTDFDLTDTSLRKKLKNYGTKRDAETEPLCLIMENDVKHQRILLSCRLLPNFLANQDFTARYFIKLHYFCHLHASKWQGFIAQYKLSRAEVRLCQSIYEGQSIKEYSKQWNLTTGTARSQLHDVLVKTATSGQIDLLRLMILYTRA